MAVLPGFLQLATWLTVCIASDLRKLCRLVALVCFGRGGVSAHPVATALETFNASCFGDDSLDGGSQSSHTFSNTLDRLYTVA